MKPKMRYANLMNIRRDGVVWLVQYETLWIQNRYQISVYGKGSNEMKIKNN
jgi:hypothetical protein